MLQPAQPATQDVLRPHGVGTATHRVPHASALPPARSPILTQGEGMAPHVEVDIIDEPVEAGAADMNAGTDDTDTDDGFGPRVAWTPPDDSQAVDVDELLDELISAGLVERVQQDDESGGDSDNSAHIGAADDAINTDKNSDNDILSSDNKEPCARGKRQRQDSPRFDANPASLSSSSLTHEGKRPRV